MKSVGSSFFFTMFFFGANERGKESPSLSLYRGRPEACGACFTAEKAINIA